MEAADIQFRTAALGGFHKQDVQDYISKSNQEHAARLEQLEREAAQLREERDKLKERLEQRDSRLVELSAQVQQLTGQLAEQSSALETSREETAAQKRECAAQAGELKRLKERLEKAEQIVQTYEAIKDRTAGIELEAHCRAQDIEDTAQAQAAEMRAVLGRWLDKVQASYDQLCTGMETTASHIAQELVQTCKNLNGFSAELGERGTALKQLRKIYEEAEGPKMPEPLSLEEE
ncbi:hypothetical protein D1159_02265 [Pseudoflavonifractor sp. 524-17]|uniref:hypothetical protein n=1 Tax=Pseudoflavonifractor sp. 524-17 TaxID=2304577 RepID=UPI001379A0C8|nr:hypothetical protein [Pseudoflavonifractor sp. 524-17]NCE63431.1 hypothetical protein [Pseudoflavonifractor sp. 524-17]